MVWLQQSASPTLWNTLISQVRAVFSGRITYDMNWTSADFAPASWLSNPQLAAIGVSVYRPLLTARGRVDPAQVAPLWKKTLLTWLDNLAQQLGKPLIISEIGYRNSADALFQSWIPNSTSSPPDPAEQSAAIEAALVNVLPDTHIQGIFIWGWDNVGGFKLAGQSATDVIYKWYTSPDA